MNAAHLLHERQEQGGSASSYLSVQRRRMLTKEGPLLQNHEQLTSSFAWNFRRMQNMILVVGPGTPASFLKGKDLEGYINHEDNAHHVCNNENNESIGNGDDFEGNNAVGEVEEDNSQESETIEEGENNAPELGSLSRNRRSRNNIYNPFSGVLERVAPEFATSLDSMHREEQNRPQQLRSQRKNKNIFASLEHNGPIHTACWLQTPWRFSCGRENAQQNLRTYNSYEYPTQVLTVGADRMVKVWDVSGAMGMDRIIEGGWNTFNPYCNSIPTMETFRSNLKQFVRQHYHDNVLQKQPFGSVVQLAAVCTGYEGIIMHAAPLHHHPGRILTCCADGCLRLTDLIAESSSVKFDINRYARVRNGTDILGDNARYSIMALTHTMLSPNTGILCSDKGLHKFDIRVSPANQSTYPLISNLFQKTGKLFHNGWDKFSTSVAVWNPHASSTHNKEETMDMESFYVFVGGSSSTVALWDVRMDGSSRGNAVEHYKPEYLDVNASVSVSGLDISRDGQELLVSYETDQIYTFQIGCSVENTHGKRIIMSDFDQPRENNVKARLSVEYLSFGGHFDRLTFLKRAKYAGPNDEYIVTGSDSGHAWIFERQSGTVVSLLASDTPACNGVIPHPTLPFFITHGGDTFAKLWRATPPIDPTTDDSPSGRASRAAIQPYEESLVTNSWGGVQKNLWNMPFLMPDYFESTDERNYVHGDVSEFSSDCRSIAVGNNEAPRYHGNALEVLSSLLTYNQYALFKSIRKDEDIPVKSHPCQFYQHVSKNNLRQQADRLGLQFENQNLILWWYLYPMYSNHDIHAADLVPDCPSSWIRCDWLMNRHERKKMLDSEVFLGDELVEVMKGRETKKIKKPPWLWSDCNSSSLSYKSLIASNEDPSDWEENSRALLYETALLLKEAGNEAAKDGQNDHTAARRYDKAIQYCAMALMHTWSADVGLEHLSASPFRYVVNPDCDPRKMDFDTWRNKDFNLWSPLLKILITCRLNLALLFLKKSKVQSKSNNNLYQPHRATSHAREAVQLLEPFTSRPGKIVRISDDKTTSTRYYTHHPQHRSTGSSNKDVVVLKDDEPLTTFHEAYALQSKAFYRWGCASFETKDYASAVEKFTAALQICPVPSESTERSTPTTDPLTVKKLNEAKRYYRESQKNERVKFQRAFAK